MMTSKVSPRFPTIHLTSLIIHHQTPRVNTLICFNIIKKTTKNATYQQVAFMGLKLLPKITKSFQQLMHRGEEG